MWQTFQIYALRYFYLKGHDSISSIVKFMKFRKLKTVSVYSKYFLHSKKLMTISLNFVLIFAKIISYISEKHVTSYLKSNKNFDNTQYI